jgi:triacylglycerol lipase
MNIVLVHGILGFREKFGIEYFCGVEEHFTAKGHKVIRPILDPTRGIEDRGGQLRDCINTALANGHLDAAQKTDIFAHSMGGLDSRWMLSPANPSRIQAPIRSLTTISTPHLGSPIADLIDAPEKLAPFGHLPFGPNPDPLGPALEALGISLEEGLRNLTTAYCTQFSETYINNPAVAYLSVAGAGRQASPPTCGLFFLFHQYISALTGEANDGLVTLSSAHWGNFDRNTWLADHADEVGTNLDSLGATHFPWLANYDLIASAVEAL